MYSDMSCLMYQPYASYFPYQRAGTSTSAYQDPIKKFHASLDKVHDTLHNSSNYPSSLGLSTPHSHTHGSSSTHPLLSGSAGINTHLSGIGSGTASTSSSTIVTKQEELDEKELQSLQPKDTQFISSNCVIFTYTTGDVSSNVDQHFTRALNQPSSFNNLSESSSKTSSNWKDNNSTPVPMSQRNFPPSFWNSNYQPPPSTSFGLGHHHDPYSHMTSSLHSMGSFAQDPWSRYPFSNQGHSYSHHQSSLHDLSSYSYMTGATNRFNSQFSSFMPSAGKLSSLTGQYDLHSHSKHASDPWATSSRYHTDPFATSTSHHQDPYGLYGGALSGTC